MVYVIRPGDSVYSVSRRYGVSPMTVIRMNRLETPGALVPGQTLVLPVDRTVHTVTRGQTLYGIARSYGVTLPQLLAANPQIVHPDRIDVGQTVYIPVPPPKLGLIEVNGYALPGISDEVLELTLPYLTYLSLFSYEVRADGSLRAPSHTSLAAAARQAGVAPLMVITNIAEGAGFSTELAHVVLTDAAVQQTLIRNILSALQSGGYYGLNIDFEYIAPADGDAYDAFLRTVVSALNPLGYAVFTALAPKTGAGQQGLLYEAHRYPVHGQYANRVILMTYEWGYTYGPPMAVAPADQVRRVLDYAVTAIPPGKILMGMPNYGYDWTLPYRQGTAARSVSNTQAVALAVSTGSVIEYNTLAEAPYFYYADGSGARHVVYFEDARSTQARLKLVDEYGLAGVSYWTINRFFAQNWLVLESMYDIRKVL